MTRSQALALGSPTVLALLGCLAWAAIDWAWHKAHG